MAESIPAWAAKDFIRERMTDVGIATQRDLAKRLGMTPASLSTALGKLVYGESFLVRLANELKVDVEEIRQPPIIFKGESTSGTDILGAAGKYLKALLSQRGWTVHDFWRRVVDDEVSERMGRGISPTYVEMVLRGAFASNDEIREQLARAAGFSSFLDLNKAAQSAVIAPADHQTPLGHVVLLRFEQDERITAELTNSNAGTSATDDSNDLEQELQTQLGRLTHCTFDSFDFREGEIPEDGSKGLFVAWDAVRTFSEQEPPDGWILLFGGYGIGKTHLAVAAVNHRLELGRSARFVVVPDLLDRLRAMFPPDAVADSSIAAFDGLKACDFLVLDDLGAEASTDWANDKLFQLFNYRYNQRLPTIITTNAIENVHPRIRSRLLDVDLTAKWTWFVPDYRSKQRRSMPSVGTPFASIGDT